MLFLGFLYIFPKVYFITPIVTEKLVSKIISGYKGTYVDHLGCQVLQKLSPALLPK